MPQDILPLVIGIVVGVIIVGLIVLSLILRPSETLRGIHATQQLSARSFDRARIILRAVSNYWNLSGERKRHEEWCQKMIPTLTRKRIVERKKKNLPVDETEIRLAIENELGPVWEPTVGVIVSAWTRRMTYLLLVSFLFVGGYVLTEPITPLIVGNSQRLPSLDVLYGLLRHTQVLIGVVLVSCVALAAMLIEESSPQLPVAVKIEPSIPRARIIIHLVIAIFMLFVNVCAVAALSIVGIDFQQAGEFPVIAALVALISIMLSIALGILLVRGAMWKSAGAICLPILGGLAALLVCLAGGIAATGAFILRGLYSISQSLRIEAKSDDSNGKPKPDDPNRAR